MNLDRTPRTPEALRANAWIEIEWLTHPDTWTGTTRLPWARVTLWSHPFNHPECNVIDFADVRSDSGREKALAKFERIIKEGIA